jgi:hypothetical protein
MSKQQAAALKDLKARHPRCRAQLSAHGAGNYSVQFFKSGKLVADYDL